MTLKRGRFGQFLACTGYPDCKTTRRLDQAEKKPDVPLEESCPRCGSQMVLRYGRYGEFTACSKYPACKYIKPKTVGVACPKTGCAGEVVERRSKTRQGLLRMLSLPPNATSSPGTARCQSGARNAVPPTYWKRPPRRTAR